APMPDVIRDDMAFIDRLHFYLPGWEVPKMRNEHFTDHYGFVIDYLAERKLNNLGIGLYGCWCVQYDGEITEWINVPVPDHPELKREWTIRWYSPTDCKERQITYLPPIFEHDFFGDVVAYGQERGVEVIPYVNSLGHNTLIPRIIPEFAAKNESGEPQGYGYCLSNPDVVEFVTGWYEHIYETYLKPHGVHTFHIQLDEVGTKFCRCPECSQRPMEEMFQDWAITLAKHLVSVGVENVVMYNDQFTRHMEAWDEAFVERLREEGLIDHVIIDWWWYSNESINPQADPMMGFGVRSWVKPMTCYYNWSRWDPRKRNVDKMLQRAQADRAEGAASYSVFDEAWGLEFDALAEYAWNPRGAGPIHLFEEKWAQVRGDGDVLEARRWLDRAAETSAFGLLWYYT
ncbi:MAG: BREX system Lon protease-like protein BrxL, partial [Armatimonadota bacterium]